MSKSDPEARDSHSRSNHGFESGDVVIPLFITTIRSGKGRVLNLAAFLLKSGNPPNELCRRSIVNHAVAVGICGGVVQRRESDRRRPRFNVSNG